MKYIYSIVGFSTVLFHMISCQSVSEKQALNSTHLSTDRIQSEQSPYFTRLDTNDKSVAEGDKIRPAGYRYYGNIGSASSINLQLSVPYSSNDKPCNYCYGQYNSAANKSIDIVAQFCPNEQIFSIRPKDNKVTGYVFTGNLDTMNQLAGRWVKGPKIGLFTLKRYPIEHHDQLFYHALLNATFNGPIRAEFYVGMDKQGVYIADLIEKNELTYDYFPGSITLRTWYESAEAKVSSIERTFLQRLDIDESYVAISFNKIRELQYPTDKEHKNRKGHTRTYYEAKVWMDRGDKMVDLLHQDTSLPQAGFYTASLQANWLTISSPSAKQQRFNLSNL